MTDVCEELDKYMNDVDRITMMSSIHSFESFYLQQGAKMFKRAPLEGKEEAELLSILKGVNQFFRSGQCFKNATDLIWISDKFTYCEGFALSDQVPIALNHAWVEFEGRAIDLTWRLGEKDTKKVENLVARAQFNTRTIAYMGIKISRNRLCRAQLGTSRYSPVAEFEILSKLRRRKKKS